MEDGQWGLGCSLFVVVGRWQERLAFSLACAVLEYRQRLVRSAQPSAHPTTVVLAMTGDHRPATSTPLPSLPHLSLYIPLSWTSSLQSIIVWLHPSMAALNTLDALYGEVLNQSPPWWQKGASLALDGVYFCAKGYRLQHGVAPTKDELQWVIHARGYQALVWKAFDHDRLTDGSSLHELVLKNAFIYSLVATHALSGRVLRTDLSSYEAYELYRRTVMCGSIIVNVWEGGVDMRN
jgi:hypothetical protein